MQELLAAIRNYFKANSPERRAKAFNDLVDAYNQADKGTVAISVGTANMFQKMARDTNHESIEGLLRDIATDQPLMQKILEFLSCPVVEVSGLPDIIIRPEKPVCRSIARIGINANGVTVFLPEKNDDFMATVKTKLGYDWNGNAWEKKVSGWDSASNIAAELGHRLLAAGFWIAPPTSDIKDLIVEESFEPEHRRKVMVRASGRYEGWFVVWWARSEDCYDDAKKISGSRYNKPSIVVPPEFCDEVQDFAQQHKFIITPAAQRAIDKAKALIDAALLVQVEVVEDDVMIDDGIPVLSLPESSEIDDDLADYD